MVARMDKTITANVLNKLRKCHLIEDEELNVAVETLSFVVDNLYAYGERYLITASYLRSKLDTLEDFQNNRKLEG